LLPVIIVPQRGTGIPMVIKAYVLAADPAWIEASVGSYYGIVEEIVVSYDRSGRGWTGVPIPVDECLDRLRAADPDKKMRLVPGDFARTDHSPADNDTNQRQHALEEAGRGADWVLSLDTDEVLPNAVDFARRLREEVPAEYTGIYWPMRVMYRQVAAGKFLEVCGFFRQQNSEYPGCAAVRSGAKLEHIRFPEGPRFRYDVRPTWVDPVDGRRHPVQGVIPKSDAIVHFSWARSEASLRTKLRSWSHSNDRGGWEKYLDEVWVPSPRRWMLLHNFHPIWPKRWPALRPATLPASVTRGIDIEDEMASLARNNH
jgi:hypothetical protein